MRFERSAQTGLGGSDVAAVAGERIQAVERQRPNLIRHALHPIQAIGNDALVRFSRHHRRPQLTPGVSMTLSIRQKMKADFLLGQDQRAVPRVR